MPQPIQAKQVNTGAPSQGIGGGNSEGSASSLARSDHDHKIRTTTGPTDLTVAAVADGDVLTRSGATIAGVGKSTLKPTLSKSFWIETPDASEDVGLWVSGVAVTITSVLSWVRGGASPSVTWNLRHNTDPSAGTADVFSANPVTTSESSVETDNSGFNDNTLAAGEALRFITSAASDISGAKEGIHLTIEYTED